LTPLSQRELNRALLARQGLLERQRTPLPRMLERMGGLQAQYAPSMYVGLWTRLDALERDEVTRALERRTIVQGWLMRITVHLVTRGDYWPIALAVRDARRKQWLRTRQEPITGAEMEDAAELVRAQLEDAGELHRKDVEQLVGKARAQGVGLWLDVVRVPPLGTWEKRRADLYALAEHWIGPPGEATREQGVELLVRRYLGAFGPATRAEIANWAGLPVTDIETALGPLKLRRFRGPDGADLVDLPRAPLPPADTPAPVRFLPWFDATLMAHARRTQVLPERHRERIFHVKNPRSTAPFLVDGAVAGGWHYENGRIVIEPFERLDAATRRAVDQEAERLAEFHA
jgi:hypothetical protein